MVSDCNLIEEHLCLYGQISFRIFSDLTVSTMLSCLHVSIMWHDWNTEIWQTPNHWAGIYFRLVLLSLRHNIWYFKRFKQHFWRFFSHIVTTGMWHNYRITLQSTAAKCCSISTVNNVFICLHHAAKTGMLHTSHSDDCLSQIWTHSGLADEKSQFICWSLILIILLFWVKPD